MPKEDFDKRYPPTPKPAPALETLVATHLIGAINWGTITITYKEGRPIQVERKELFKIGDEV